MYPALDLFLKDRELVRTTRGAVYLAFQPPTLDWRVPRPVKLEEICHLAKVRWASASEARAWLIQHGYWIEHGRDARGMPLVTLAWAIGDDRQRESHG